MKKIALIVICAVSCLSAFQPLHAAKKKKSFATQEVADLYLTTHYNKGCQYFNDENWFKAYDEFEKVIYFFPESDAAAEAAYYLGVCYYEMKEYNFANQEFNNYITASVHPEFFEDAIEFKYCIAEHFKIGKKKRAFDFRYCPKWITAREEALTIYDEIIVALPNHALTVKALHSKAELLRKMGEFRESIDTYQILIRRFPKDESTPDCYVRIAEVYVEQSKLEFQNPDILAFAELNARRFANEFPRDERVATVNKLVHRIKEIYARGLYRIGLFYEKKGHPHAAAIYYQTSINEFPDTNVATAGQERLNELDYSKEKKDVVVPLSILREELDPLDFEEKATPAEGDEWGLPQYELPVLEANRPSDKEYDASITEVVNEPEFGANVPAEEDAPSGSLHYYQDFGTEDEMFLYQSPIGYDDNQVSYTPFVQGHPQEVYEKYEDEEDNYTTFENGKTISHCEEPGIYCKIVRKPEPPPKTYVHYSLLKKRPVKRAQQCQ